MEAAKPNVCLQPTYTAVNPLQEKAMKKASKGEKRSQAELVLPVIKPRNHVFVSMLQTKTSGSHQTAKQPSRAQRSESDRRFIQEAAKDLHRIVSKSRVPCACSGATYTAFAFVQLG